MNAALHLIGHPNIPNDWTERADKSDIWTSASVNRSMQADDLKDDDDIVVAEMKTKVEAARTPAAKINLVTHLPDSWGVRKIQRTFNVTYHIAQKAYKLHQKDGLVSIATEQLLRNCCMLSGKYFLFMKGSNKFFRVSILALQKLTGEKRFSVPIICPSYEPP